MSQHAQLQLVAVRSYQAANPDVDWTANVVVLARDSAGEWFASRHRPKDDRCFCHPDQPRGHELDASR